MIEFITIILRFASNGEKTGWTYIEIPADIAQQLKPGNRRSFRVRGLLDAHPIAGVAVMPLGEGKFILALNADMRKGIHKGEGAMLQLRLEEDTDFVVLMPEDLAECLEYEPEAYEFFNSLAKSHRNYFIKWIDSAKTQATRDKRIAQTVNAMVKRWDYGMMIRASRKDV
ncbi:DUF1905 domain-containing protein [Mucilaginibacter limnophilus]|uniref:DUF1905 domain-containing protein n=1 Tax=Mucilaginibacter limnophilus TaxID=1932778 RepID=A0A3S2VLJ1_9SPHI|nr:YdeI/OmpD-associated family protein [Mucilaginibacter limnophilus]RVU00059.1 DUF1905 domain-containing protein [Mucilaginibacter limnophilus]